jgi:spore maturation protein A
MDKISANISANILGLGNAATPLGMAAAGELGKRCLNGKASKELCNLVVINTASLQIVPATVAAVRAALGCSTPLDILPAVWISGAASLAIGLTVAFVCERLSRLNKRRIT